MVGALLLAAKAALRAGAGLVSVASYPEFIDVLASKIEELMTVRFSHQSSLAANKLIDFMSKRKVNAIV
jgi:NAD(P)H-hydrate repair Nnr-like enzyme with NAD(P)H-hydrate dehydratase domain